MPFYARDLVADRLPGSTGACLQAVEERDHNDRRRGDNDENQKDKSGPSCRLLQECEGIETDAIGNQRHRLGHEGAELFMRHTVERDAVGDESNFAGPEVDGLFPVLTSW